MRELLVPARTWEDVFPQYRGTPVGELLACHNLGAQPRQYSRAELLIVMCMDFRKRLVLPENFAYVLRVGGANIKPVGSYIAFAVAIGRVSAMTVIVHDQCAMLDVASQRDQFVSGLVANGGWDRGEAEEYVAVCTPVIQIEDPAGFAMQQCRRLRKRFPRLLVAPLFYSVSDGMLNQIREP